jgi:hypothetical protein
MYLCQYLVTVLCIFSTTTTAFPLAATAGEPQGATEWPPGTVEDDLLVSQAQLDQISKDFGVVVEVRNHTIIVGTSGLATKETMSQIEDAIHKVFGNDFGDYAIVHIIIDDA